MPDGVNLRMWLAGGPSDAFAARRRRYAGPAGCGMCGLETLAAANRAVPVVTSGLRVSSADVAAAVAALPALQGLNMRTRAVHAAAFWQRRQEMVAREDVAGITRWISWRVRWRGRGGARRGALW